MDHKRCLFNLEIYFHAGPNVFRIQIDGEDYITAGQK